MKSLNPILISGKEVFPLIEGGKGINGSDGRSSGAWAHENCVGTFSGVSPDYYDENGQVILEKYLKKDRRERHQEMIEQSIKGGIAQAQIAHEISGGNGRIHMNMLWELGGSEQILNGVLEKAKGLIHGITCGAGLPYKLGEIASRFGVYYYPIVSSARAFQILWKRAYANFKDFLGGVVYEDPWLAGGHNGLSNAEDPTKPQSPYERLVELRKTLNNLGLNDLPIIMAGGVWNLDEWDDYINNPDIGKIAFQFGTRPMITQESPISDAWKKLMLQLKKGDVILQKFSPTGFFSSAIKNTFLEKLMDRKDGEIVFSESQNEEFSAPLKISETKTYYIKAEDVDKAQKQIAAVMGLSEAHITRRMRFIEDKIEYDMLDDGERTETQIKAIMQYNRFIRTGKCESFADVFVYDFLLSMPQEMQLRYLYLMRGQQKLIKFCKNKLYKADAEIKKILEEDNEAQV